MMPRTLLLSDGSRVRALESGVGDPVVLIHGVGLRAEAWRPQIESLSKHHRVFAIDMPGHGESDPLPVQSRLPDFVDWAAKVLKQLNLGPVSLAGHSMGALIALGIAVEHPGLVSRVALLNVVHSRSEAARQAVMSRAEEIAGGTVSVEAPLARWFGAADDAAKQEAACWLRAVSPQGYTTAYRAFAEGDDVYAARLGSVKVPVLALTGELDMNSTADMAKTLGATVAHGTSVIVPGERHMVHLTAPQIVCQALEDWLNTKAVFA